MGSSLDFRPPLETGTGSGPAGAGFPHDVLVQPVIDLQSVPYAVRSVVVGVELDGVSEGSPDVPSVAREVARVGERLPHLDLFVSVGGAPLAYDPGLLPRFLEEASRAGLSPTRLVFDLSVPVFGQVEQGPLLETLDRLRNFGVRVSLSRAGVGTNGLQLMLALRPDYLWIAGAAVAGCGADFYKRAIVESLSRLAWKFGALSVAEGVCSASDAATARDLGISLALGPWVGRPVNVFAPAAELSAGNFPFVVNADGPGAASANQNRPEVDR